jgi:cytosine/adenosine deaminase-related metal-dependent hydrolase
VSTAQVFSAAVVIPVVAPPVMDGAVAVVDGHIAHCGSRRWVLRALRADGLDFAERHWDGALLPGLVNAHTHLQYTRMDSVGARNYGGFWDWSHAFAEVYHSSDPAVRASALDWGRAAADGAQQSIRAGVTALADVVTDLPALTALQDAGLRGLAYWEVFDFSNESWAEHGRAETRKVLREARVGSLGLSPHAPYSLGSAPLLEVPDLARQAQMRIHIHLGEDPAEADVPLPAPAPPWVRATDADGGDGWPSYGALRGAGRRVSSARFVDSLGVLGPDCHVAHGVYLDDADRALLRLRGTAVALCPRSNAVIGLDEPPVAAYLREGSRIAVGTDSLASSPSLDLLADVALLFQLARSQGYTSDDLPARLLRAATLGGAEAMGMADGPQRIGQLGVGAPADMCFLEIGAAARASSAKDALFELVSGPRCAATAIGGSVVNGDEELV